MFSPALEAVLHIAMREAISRRHAYLAVEHLLFALAHDQDGERILGACDVNLPALRKALDAYLAESVEQLKRGNREPEQTIAFRRMLQEHALDIVQPDICVCGGLIHAENGGPDDEDGNPGLRTRCDQCRRSQEDVEEDLGREPV